MMFNVSVVIPSYNYGKYITQSLDSVINQAKVNVDVIVVDDGSTDDTMQILRSYHDRIRIFQQEHMGVSYARNLGIKKAECGFITFLDADDWLLENSLFRRCDFLTNHPEYDWVYGRWLVADSNGDIIGISDDISSHSDGVFEGNIFPSLIREYAGINTMTPLFRTSDVRAVGGYNTDLKSFEDYDFLLKMSRGKKVGYCADVDFGVQRLHLSHHSPNPELRYVAELEILKGYKHDKEAISYLRQTYNRRIANLYNYLACIYSEDGNVAKALLACLQSILSKPVQCFAFWFLFYTLIGRSENAREHMTNELMEIYSRAKEGGKIKLERR